MRLFGLCSGSRCGGDHHAPWVSVVVGNQIIRQPHDDRLAVFSSIVDGFTITDATAAELLDFFAEEAAERARESVQKILDKIQVGEKAYHQFTLTYEDALVMHERNFGPLPLEMEPE